LTLSLFIEWAKNKQIQIPIELLNWYEEQNKLKLSKLPDYLDPVHPLHSQELKIAIDAWTAVLKNNPDKPSRGTRKKYIEDWLNENYKGNNVLSANAKERIALMLNPDKEGGAPKTG
jgi:hypothetical protein